MRLSSVNLNPCFVHVAMQSNSLLSHGTPYYCKVEYMFVCLNMNNLFYVHVIHILLEVCLCELLHYEDV
jgi:hypothetical protein